MLAAPTLWLLIYSAVDVMRNPRNILAGGSKARSEAIYMSTRIVTLSLALPQLVVAILALTSYHVQIITRLSSAYPLWYIWLATRAQENEKQTSIIIRWAVIYALIQAGLYASFLPPA